MAEIRPLEPDLGNASGGMKKVKQIIVIPFKLKESMLKRSVEMRNSLIKLSNVALLCFIAGCVAHLSEEVKSQIQAVSVRQEVTINREFFLDKKYGYTPGALALGSAILSLAEDVARAVKNPEQALRDTMSKYEIVPSEILRNEFIYQLKKADLFEILDTDDVNAEFVLTLISHFYKPVPLSKKIAPYMWVKCELIRSDGTILWKTTMVSEQGHTLLPSNSLVELFENPNLIKEGFIVASQMVSENIVRAMTGE